MTVNQELNFKKDTGKNFTAVHVALVKEHTVNL
jgi:hypothetical protein